MTNTTFLINLFYLQSKISYKNIFFISKNEFAIKLLQLIPQTTIHYHLHALLFGLSFTRYHTHYTKVIKILYHNYCIKMV